MSTSADKTLRGIQLFVNLPPEEVAALETRCKWSSYPAGGQILERDSDDRDIYFVVAGSVRIVNFSTSGREIALATIEAGSYFGELSAIDGQRRSANVVAVTACSVATITPMVFSRLLVKHPTVAMHVLQRMAGIIRVADDRIMDLSTLRAVQRVYVELIRLTDRDIAVPELWVIRPMLSHSEIASRASTTRETVARVLGQLAHAGIVERKSKALYIRDKERLERLAELSSPEGMVTPRVTALPDMNVAD
ncbi:MAG: Crp/Fnr family transcriptional regulator [Alphaproteobacteria bacterium]|nr:Crp/Fnr family transcriptional regulator [Alphaproteobacteria bacterium]